MENYMELEIIRGGVNSKRSPGRGRPEKWPYEKMQVGDHIEVPLNGRKAVYVQTNALNAVRMYRMFSGDKEFKVETSTKQAEGYLFVWRIR